MVNDKEAEELISEAFEDPVQFSERGRTFDLLQYYLEGYDIDSLRGFLQSDDLYMQSIGAFIATEMGSRAASLLDDLIPLLQTEDLGTRYDILESVAVCSDGQDAVSFRFVVEAMVEDHAIEIRNRAMELVSMARRSQWEGALDNLDRRNTEHYTDHQKGLSRLLKGVDSPGEIIGMLNSESSIIRKYGAIMAKTHADRFPLLKAEVFGSNDPDIRNFAELNFE